MEIRAKCKYDYNSVKALTHLSAFKTFRKTDPKKQLLFWSITFVILFIVIILEIIAFGPDIILFILLGADIIGILLHLFSYFIFPKIQYESMKNLKNVENEYIFSNSSLKVFSKSNEYNGEAEIEYSFFVKVHETSRYLFLFQTNNQVFIIDKKTIEGGTIEEIRSALSASIKGKYIVYKY